MLESAAMAHSPVTVEPAVAPGAFKPFVPASESPAEFTVKAVVLGAIFGVIFGAVTVYLALRAGLTVSASIPIAVLAIAVFKRFSRSTILENNIVQTIGSAGESIAAGVVFTIPAFLFIASGGAQEYFNIVQIVTLAAVGGHHRRADDGADAAGADRQGARHPSVSGGHRVRGGPDRG